MMIRLLLLFLLSSSFICTKPCSALGTTSTLAISPSTNTICAVVAANRTVKCARGPVSFTLEPNASVFTSVSGGRDFLCGLRSGPPRTPLLCWGTSIASSVTRPQRIYRGQPPLEDLTVGAYHVAAAVRGAGGVRWWRDERRFPPVAAGKYRSLTSGNGFTCGINASNLVQCWGTGNDRVIELAFANVTMNTIEAGDSHACGVTGAGELRCGGRNDSGRLDAPATSAPFEYSALALGDTHSCALRKANGTVVCWGGGASRAYSPKEDPSFTLIVAGGELTCGVHSGNFSVMCWRVPSPSSSKPVEVEVISSLGQVLPGICRVRTESCCREFPDSQTLCGRSSNEVICRACDLPRLPPPDSPSPQPPPSSSTSRRRGKRFWAAVIVGAVGSFAGLLSIIYCLWVGVCRRKKKIHNSVQPAITALANRPPSLRRDPSGNRFNRTRSTSSTASGSSAKSIKSRVRRQGSRVMRRQRSGPSTTTANEYAEGSVKVFTFDELSTATNCFALDTKIGSGSFGTVYRGKLPDGREVAIKRRDPPVAAAKEREEIVQQDKEGEFQSEVSFLSRLHHKHLVGLVGFCEEGDERILVYEYMKNGSLHDHIHPRTNGRGGKEQSAGGDPLSFWKMRIKVLLDASRGIDYLHNYAVPPIIHRDIKSSNILLDATWTAKVSDFGLSLSEPELGGVAAPVKKAGTVGYMDPEYYALHYLTAKSDVYGFGVVMLEVLTGKRAIFKDAEEDNLNNVVDYASWWINRGEVSQVLDPRMPAPGPREVEAVELVANTALYCVTLEAKKRPTMTDVVANLEVALSLCEESQDNLSSASISFTSMD